MRLDEIKERLGKATEGEWSVEVNNMTVCDVGDLGVHTTAMDTAPDYDDADFIAHSKQDIAWLIIQLENQMLLLSRMGLST